VYVPADSQDFTDLSLPAPGFLWLCNEASGNLVPTIGSVNGTLTANATPLYEQTVAGWTRPFVGTTDATAGQRFGCSHAVLDLAAGQSMACLVYASAASGAATRLLAGRAVNGFRMTSGGLPVSYHNNVAATGAANHADIATVRPWLWYRNATTNASGLMTDLEHMVGTHDESAISGVMWALGATGTSNPATARYGWAAMWIGADAETIAAKATLTTLGWSVAW
jgi:hypothetical protein